jgi:hypothetical protein
MKRILTISLGVFWIIDGVLQLQPAMFTSAFVNDVLAPNLQNQPGVIAGVVAFGIHVFSINIFWCNLASALIQLLIGVLLIFPFPDSAQQFGLWLSVAWALIVWIFGEGFGALFTGSASFYTGAPGSALLYLILALGLLYGFYKNLPRVAGVLLIFGGLLNLVPMFWRSGMLSMLVMTPTLSGSLAGLGQQGTIFGNLIAVDALLFFGIFLILAPNRHVACVAIVFLLAVWWLGQGWGGVLSFPFGTATDPNSAPLFMLFLLPIFFPTTARSPRPQL